jgi:hypothetical protein
MLTRKGIVVLALGIILTVVCGSVYAQKTVYKWVDEDGVVHFSEEPPVESPDVEIETLTTDPAPDYVAPAQPAAKPPSASSADVKSQVAQPKTPKKEKIAPLRAAEIAKCVQAGTGDQDWCETFWADYGAPVRTVSGGFTPRMFNDLPECTEAWEERNRRGLYPGDRP